MMANRQTRDEETRAYDNRKAVERAAEERPPTSFSPPQLLPEIEPRDGWVHRWVRVDLLSEADKTNVSARFREGWEPCKAADYPEVMLVPGGATTKFPAGVEIGGLLLCRAPKEQILARKNYYLERAKANMVAVDNNLMKQSDARMPIFKEGSTSVSFGSGRK